MQIREELDRQVEERKR